MKKSAASRKSSSGSTSSKKTKTPPPENGYSWREGSRFKIDPQLAGERISRLKSSLGREVEADDVLEDARRPGSPLHAVPEFYWNDDSKAAEKWRRTLAGNIIRSLVVYVETVPSEARVAVPAFVNVEPRAGGARGKYEHIMVAMGSPSTREIVVEAALRQFEALQKRYGHLAELAAVFTAIGAARTTKKTKRSEGTPPEPQPPVT